MKSFSPAFGNRPSYLVGRDQLLDRLLYGFVFDSPDRADRSVVVLGQRGSGKTSFTVELAELGDEHGYVVAAPTVASEGMMTGAHRGEGARGGRTADRPPSGRPRVER